MIATRPDWCISRQRIWGVPIAVFLCEGCNEPILDAALNHKIVEMFERDGVEAWHTTDVAALLPEGAKCAKCAGVSFRKETDILDVWFDSGTSWFAVAESDPDLKAAYKSFQKDDGREGASTLKEAISTGLVPFVPPHIGGPARLRSLLARGDGWLDARRARPRHVQVTRQWRRSCRYRGAPGR